MRRLRNKTRRELQHIIANDPNRPRITIAKVLLKAFWYFCAVCFFYSFFVFKDVLFDMKLPVLLAVLVGVIGVRLTRKKEYYILAFVGYGALVFGVPLMFNNMFLGKVDKKEVKLKIAGRTSDITKDAGWVNVTYLGYRLDFRFAGRVKIRKASYVVLTLTKGRLGYDIVTDRRLAN